jgi:hypothetical protein
MAKVNGLGQALYVQGYDLSSDASALSGIGYTQELLDTTSIDLSAMERITGRLDATLSVNGWFDNAAGKGHAAYLASSKLPTGDRVVTYQMGTAIEGASYILNAKQATYDISNSSGSALATTATFSSNASITGFEGSAYAVMLDAGATTYTATGNGTTVDQAASSAAGSVGVLQFVSGSSVSSFVIKIQHSADGSTWSDLITFTTISSDTPTAEIKTSSGTVNRYIRLTATLSGTNGKCQVSFHRK